MLIGIDFGATAKTQRPVRRRRHGVGEMWESPAHTLTDIGHAFTSAKVRKEVHSIVGITVATQE